MQKQITELAGQRDSYLRLKTEEAGGAEESLDHKIQSAVNEQAAKRGLRYLKY